MSEWESISTAPIDGAAVVVWQTGKTPVVAYMSQCLGFGWQSIPGDKRYEPTHWMPLPDPPNKTPAERRRKRYNAGDVQGGSVTARLTVAQI